MATILKGAWVMTREGLKKDWGVKVEKNKIVEVGPNDTLTLQEGDEISDHTEQIIMPGFVNGHMHMYGVLSHGITTEALVTEFSSFLDDFWWPYVEDRLDHDIVETTSRWACVEMIKSGITCFMDVLEGPNSIPGALNVEKKVIEEAGLRGILSFEACQRISEDNAQLGLKENYDFCKENNFNDGLVKGMMSIHTLFTGSKEYVMQAKKMADELGVDIHMHMSESVFEPNWCLDKYGKRTVDVYNEIGFLDNKVFASQAVQVEPAELDILAEKGTRIVSMPLSNCEVGGGFAPLPGMLERGIKVGLGTDGYVNNFFEVMRGAFLMHKAVHQNPMVMPAQVTYEMATWRGAEAMGFNDVGALEVGKKADLFTLNIDTPTPINEHNCYDQIILFRNPSDIADVMVDGKWIQKAGELLTIDEAAAKVATRACATKFWTLS